MSPLLAGFTWLLLFQCAGEALAYLFDLPIPGPVLGMALLFATLLDARRDVPTRWTTRPRDSPNTCRCCSFRPAWA